MASRHRAHHPEEAHQAPPPEVEPPKQPAPSVPALPDGYVLCKALRTCLVHGVAIMVGEPPFAMLADEAQERAVRGDLEIVR